MYQKAVEEPIVELALYALILRSSLYGVKTHLGDDETVAKMGHPDFRCRLPVPAGGWAIEFDGDALVAFAAALDTVPAKSRFLPHSTSLRVRNDKQEDPRRDSHISEERCGGPGAVEVNR